MIITDHPNHQRGAVWRYFVKHAPAKRTTAKILHWSVAPLMVWFFFVAPEDVNAIGPAAFRFHSFLGLIFVSLVLGWFAWYMRKGLLGRPGPKLSTPLQRFHRILHTTLIWGMFGVAFTGFLLGLTSTVQLWAGGIVPIAIPLGLPRLNDLVGQVHIVEYYILAAIVVAHAGFHIWRHVKLRDNALRIMAPRALHRYL